MTLVLNTMQWSALSDINEVSPIDDDDYLCLKELREVLAKYGAIGRFGVHLLHKHFDLSEDEALVEYTDEKTRTLHCRVEARQNLPTTNRIETQWAFSVRDSATVICHGYCYYDRGHSRQHQRV